MDYWCSAVMPPHRDPVGGGYAPVRTAVSRASTADDDSDTEAGERASMYAPEPDDEGDGEDFREYFRRRSQSLIYAAATLVLMLVLVLGGSSSDGDGGSAVAVAGEAVAPLYASCKLRPTTQSELGSGLAGGTMYLTYTPGLGTDVEVQALGMSPGKHGVHIHTLGDLTDTQLGISTGGHYNPHSATHGCAPSTERKAGDLGNMLVNGQGEGFYSEQRNALIRLDGPTSVIGRSLVVHALEDNCAPIEGPQGDLSAGARIAFCTIGRAEETHTTERAAIQRSYARAAAADAEALRGLDSCSWLEAKLPPTIHPLAYSLVLEPGLDGAERFLAEMSTTISVSAPTSCVIMHARNLLVTGVKVEHTTAATHQHILCSDASSCTLVVSDIGRDMISINILPVHMATGAVATLVIQYSGEYTGGMYISAPSPQTPPIIVTQFEQTGARSAFPCFDEPGLKAEFRAAIIVPQRAGLVVLTNMPEESRSVVPGRPHMARVQFATSPPMSTYLVAFVIGELTKISSSVAGRGGAEVNVWSVPELAPNLGEAAQVAAASFAFYSHLTGVEFALPKADLVAVPGKGGAMENWGLLLFDEKRFLVNPSTEGEYEKQECRNVVCHEVAHQWFGNLVTDADWDSLWMNEGFASFFEYLCMDGVQGNTFSHVATMGAVTGPWPRTRYGAVDIFHAAATPDGEGEGVHEGPHQHALRTEASATAHALYHQGDHVGGDLVYSKGAATLAMIYDYMERVQPGSFKRGTNLYLTEHAYSTVVSDDFWSALGTACDSDAPGCAGIAAGMGGAWTRNGGYPVLRVSRRGGGLSIRQRPINPLNQASSDAVWWLPLTIGDSSGAVGVASCAASTTSCTVAQPDGLSTALPWILNPTGTGLYRVDYDDYTDILTAVSSGSMDPRGVAGLIDDSFALLRTPGKSPALTITTALQLLKAAFEATGDYTGGRASATCPYELDGECDPLLWGSTSSTGECPWGTDAVDCGGVNYAVWVTGIRYLRTLRTVVAADGTHATCSANLDTTIRGWIEPALQVLTPGTTGDLDEHIHDDHEHTAALEEELLLVAGVEAGLPSAIAQACASVTAARAATGFYAPDSGTLANEPPTLQPAAILARVRGVCPGATAASEWENLAEAFVASLDHGLRHNLIYAMADAEDPQLLSATLSFTLHGRPAACPTEPNSPLQHSCGSDFAGVFAAIARRRPEVALEFLRENWAEAGSISRLNLVAESCASTLQADAIAAVARAVGVDGSAAVAAARVNAAWRDANAQVMCDWLRTEAAGL